MGEWLPIESAPKDGTVIDLWMTDERGRQWRETDAYFVRDREERALQFDADGGRKELVRRRDGWWAPNHDYDNQDGWCDTPRYYNAHPRRSEWVFTEPTHWMPLPAPPLTQTATAETPPQLRE